MIISCFINTRATIRRHSVFIHTKIIIKLQPAKLFWISGTPADYIFPHTQLQDSIIPDKSKVYLNIDSSSYPTTYNCLSSTSISKDKALSGRTTLANGLPSHEKK